MTTSVLRSRKDRFARLFDANSVGIVLSDVHGHITEANDAFLTMLGYQRDDLPLRWDRMTPGEWHAHDVAKVEEVLSTGAGLAWEKEYFARDGRRVPVLVSVALLDTNRGECVAIVHDISQRAPLETALREGKESFEALYENIPLLYFTLTRDGTIRSVNAYGAKKLRYAPNELVGQSIRRLFHAEDLPAVEQRLSATARHGSAVDWEARMVRCTGSILRTRAAARLVHRVAGEDLLLLACTNVTRRWRAEQKILQQKQALRSLAARLMLAEEHERRRIAIGLHDEIGQTLALAKLKLDPQSGPKPGSEGAQKLREVDGLLDQAITALRSLTFELGSPVLHELGFEAALQGIGEKLEIEHGIRFQFEGEAVRRLLTDNAAVLLCRIVRELLRNVVTHAHARGVTLSVVAAEDHLRIVVEDDGVGFDTKGAGEGFGRTGGFGLFSVHQQLGHIGGSLEFDSSASRGTRAVVVAPLAAIEAHPA